MKTAEEILEAERLLWFAHTDSNEPADLRQNAIKMLSALNWVSGRVPNAEAAIEDLLGSYREQYGERLEELKKR